MGYKLCLVQQPQSVKPELLCCLCSGLVDTPVQLRCPHLACIGCLRTPTGKQKALRCPQCDSRIESELVLGAEPFAGVANWLRVELNSVRVACPKLCGAGHLRLSDLQRHFAELCPKVDTVCGHSGCGRTVRRERLRTHEAECPHRPVQCGVCQRQMLYKDLHLHQVKAKCSELQLKIDRKLCMKQCNREVLQHYRLLRQNSLQSMQELRKQELLHLERMGVQGYARRQPLPPLASPCGGGGETARRCGRCSRLFTDAGNHPTACCWHGGPIIDTFGGLCMACGKPSHARGCLLSAHRQLEETPATASSPST